LWGAGGRISIEVTLVLQTLGSNQPYAADQAFSAGQLGFGEDQGQRLDLGHYFGILKRRIFYFLVPFSIVAILGFYFAWTQRPTYLSEGKILVESQGIAADLVKPIVTATANERIQVIQQRLMTRNNLLSIVSKFGLFADQESSETSLLELMQQRIQIKPVDIQTPRQGVTTIAFTVGFEYESPEFAMRVANEFLTLILSEDARTRTNRESEAIRILESEVKGFEDKLDAAQTQISEIKRRPPDPASAVQDQSRSQREALAALKAELIQKTSVYSDAHPSVVALKKRIVAMEKSIAQSPQAPIAQSTPADDIEALERQKESLEKRLDDANSKLAFARLSGSLERDPQSESFQILEHPTLPQRPLKSGRLKVLGIAFALAAMAGAGAIFAAETFDRSISGGHELLGVVDSHLIVSIPYISTTAEAFQRKRRVMLGAGILVLVLLIGLAAALVYWLSVNSSWFDWSWLDVLTRSSR
jgi:uncharacterized protein involved in exopolysaccharide biosynthesis